MKRKYYHSWSIKFPTVKKCLYSGRKCVSIRYHCFETVCNRIARRIGVNKRMISDVLGCIRAILLILKLSDERYSLHHF